MVATELFSSCIHATLITLKHKTELHYAFVTLKNNRVRHCDDEAELSEVSSSENKNQNPKKGEVLFLEYKILSSLDYIYKAHNLEANAFRLHY